MTKPKYSNFYTYICVHAFKVLRCARKVLIIKMKHLFGNMFLLVGAAVIAALVMGCSRRSHELSMARMQLADNVINQAIEAGDFPGAVLCVVGRAADAEGMGDILYLKSYGNRQLTSGKNSRGEFIPDTLPMTTDAVFDMASVSKCVGTTLSVMRLIEDGKLRIDDKVERYIDNFAEWQSIPEKRGDPVERKAITVRHLLNHTSGLAPGIHVPTFVGRYEKWGNVDKQNLRDSLIVYLAKDAARNTCPGEKMRYSCLNFITLQAIVEKISGKRLDVFANEAVFEPLRLKNTWYNPIDEAEKPYAVDAPIVPTEVSADGSLLRGEVHDPTARIVNRGVSGNAGLFSTAEDLAVVASMLMNGGVVKLPKRGLLGELGVGDCVRLYSHQTIDTFFQLTDDCREHGRTLGWDTGSFGDVDDYQRVINHTGYTGTSLQMNLDEGVAIIFLTNRVHPIDDGAVGRTRALVTNIISSALTK